MTMNYNPVVIDQNTGKLQVGMQAISTSKLPEIPAAFRRGKAGQQLSILFNAIWFRNSPALATLYMGINQFETRYCFLNGLFYFFEGFEFKDQLTKISIQDLGMADLAPKVIEHLLILLRTNPQLWFKDAEVMTSPSIRVIDQGANYIGYALHPGNVIPLIHTQLNSPNCIQGVLTPLQSKWPQYAQHHNDFTQQTLINTRSNPATYLSNLLRLMNQIGITEDLSLIMLASLVHSLIAKHHLLIEVTGENEGHCLTVFKTFKTLIDDSLEPCNPIPKGLEKVKQYAFKNFLMSFDHHNDKTLKEEVQTIFIELLNGTAVAEAYPKAKYPTQCRLKRPIIIKAPDSIISLPSLLKRTLSIHLAENCPFLVRANKDQALIDNSRIELLRLTQLVSHTVYPSFGQNQTPYSVDISGFEEMHDFIRLGCEISYLIHGSPTKFVDAFIDWSIENAFLQLENNDSAYLVYLWAKDHAGVSVTQPLKEWLNEISHYAQEEGVALELISPRKLGADLKSAATLLKKLGVACVSNGRSTRLSSWTFTVDPNIGGNKPIVVNFYRGQALQSNSAADI